jgi:phenylalanyl-tRNA synthetase alpha chain
MDNTDERLDAEAIAARGAALVAEIEEAGDTEALEALRVRLLGRSGEITRRLKGLGALPAEQRKAAGAALNALRDTLAARIAARRAALEREALARRLASEKIDVSLPPRPLPGGVIHPISRTMEEIAAIFAAMGFRLAEGPDIETDWYNFGALNIPPHHPARAEHDTFYLPPSPGGETRVLRTHTSPVQIRTLLGSPPPVRIIALGRTYRADHDATHSPMFHQCEGLAIDRDLTLGHLKGCLIDFLRAFFDMPRLPVRFRASYFPFTEPSMEVDIGWNRRTGEIGAGGDWLEILGSGMVHPRVLANCGVDPGTWQGFAFGMGIERLTMLKWGINDLRLFFENDIRWLNHYGASPFRPAALQEGL